MRYGVLTDPHALLKITERVSCRDRDCVQNTRVGERATNRRPPRGSTLCPELPTARAFDFLLLKGAAWQQIESEFGCSCT